MNLDEEKSKLRRSIHFVLSTIGPDQWARAGVAIADHVAASSEFRDARVVGLYAATSEEVGTERLFSIAAAAGKCCVFPRCIRGNRLEFAAVSEWGELEAGRHGILEPPPGAPSTEFESTDLVLVPGLAFDRQGGRLGRGAGYYDRSFAPDAPGAPVLMGVAHSVQLFDSIPMDAHDRRMDALALETGVLRMGGAGKGGESRHPGGRAGDR